MSDTPTPTRIWYQSFTDPDVDIPYFTRLTAFLQESASPNVQVDVYGIQPGDRYLHPITEFRCAAQVIRNALTAQEQGYDAFVIGHFQEPALRETRAAVNMPVIGLGEATMLYGCMLGRKLGLVTINPIFVPYHEDQIERHGLQQRVVAVRAVTANVADYNKAFEDATLLGQMRDDFTNQVRPLLDIGVDVVIPAGGYPMLLFGRDSSFTIDEAIVLNGVPVAVAAAETAVGLERLNGTATSRRGTFALPEPGAVEEFRNHL